MIGARSVLSFAGRSSAVGEGAIVRDLVLQMAATLPTTGNRRPVVRLEEGMWSTGAGVILQLKRRGMPVSVAPEMEWLFGDSMKADGGEDLLLNISRAGRHEEIARRSHNVTLAESNRIFVDAVSLVDAPEERP